MNKLLYNSEWLPVPDAARYLSDMLKEDVTEADVYQLALSNRLQLSVNFVNLAYAKFGKIVQYSQAEIDSVNATGKLPAGLEWGVFPQEVTLIHPEIPDELRGEAIWYVKNIGLGAGRFVSFEDSDVHIIEGVWDVLMSGGAEIDIENRYHEVTGGPAVTVFSSRGVIVFRSDGKICQLQERFDEMEYTNAWGEQLKKLKRYITDNEIEPVEADKILQRHYEERKKLLKKIESLPASKHYFEGNRLPGDSRVVVRTDELEKFVQREEEQSVNLKKPAETKEDTFLSIIAGLLSHTRIKPEERGSAGKIVRITEKIGAPISDETIRTVLKKISNTMETRMK